MEDADRQHRTEIPRNFTVYLENNGTFFYIGSKNEWNYVSTFPIDEILLFMHILNGN